MPKEKETNPQAEAVLARLQGLIANRSPHTTPLEAALAGFDTMVKELKALGAQNAEQLVAEAIMQAKIDITNVRKRAGGRGQVEEGRARHSIPGAPFASLINEGVSVSPRARIRGKNPHK